MTRFARQLRTISRRPLLAVLFCVLAISACGGDSPVSQGSVLHRGNGDEPDSLDVHKSRTTEAGDVQRDFGEGLTGYTRDGHVVAAAAERWEISADGKEYLFYLRPDARWSNGDPVTADDFVFSFRRLVNPLTAAVFLEAANEVVNAREILAGELPPDALGVEAVGRRKLKVHLVRPVLYFIDLLTHPSAFPVHPPSVAQYGDDYARPGNLVSNGAYALESWDIGSVIELVRNERYWDNDNTSIDRVRHYVTSQPMAELNRYRAGELDTTRSIPPGAYQQMLGTRPAEVRVSPALGVYYFGFNMTKPPFADNPKLREALSLAIDRKDIVEKIVGRGEPPAFNWVPVGTANYLPQKYTWADLPTAERHKKARRLYAEAGYGPSNPLRTELRYNTSDSHKRIATAAQEMWRKVLGAEVRLINEELRVLISNVQQQEETQLFRLAWNGDYNDANTFLSTLESGNSSNFTGYQSEDFDLLMQDAATQTGQEVRQGVLRQAERAMLSDYPLIPIYFFVNKSMVSPRVEGWGDNVLNYHYSRHLSLTADD